MGILDDAIREHLDLKRKHGARDSELRELEDEALGSGDRPDPFAAGELFGARSSGEAPLAEGAIPGAVTPPPGLTDTEAAGEEPTRLLGSEPEAVGLGSADEPPSPPEGLMQVPGQEQLEEPMPGQQRLDEPPDSDSGPIDSGVAPPEAEPAAPSGSLEELIAEEEPFPEDIAAPPHETAERPPPAPEAAEAPEVTGPPEAPEDTEVREAPRATEPAEPEPIHEPPPEPESSVPDPPPPPPDAGPEPPGRARGRVEVPTEEHPPPGETGGVPPLPAYEEEREMAASADEAAPVTEPPSDQPLVAEEQEAPTSGPQLYDFETDEDPLVPSDAGPPESDDEFEALGPAEEEAPNLEEEQPFPEERGRSAGAPVEEAYEGGALDPEESYEESEGEDLWFEKGPPQDFDFEDD